MNFNNYGEVINGKQTYEVIAKGLLEGNTIGIGWDDEEYTHLDIIFKIGLDNKYGSFQRGILSEDLFVSIIDHTSYGFIPNTIKDGGYIQEKLRFENPTGDKLKELINGIIIELNRMCDTNE